jgi:NodT family efflux transporter outer membrane factor (OMF) lipoprotein
MVIVGLLACSSCAVGPDYERPRTAVGKTEAYQNAPEPLPALPKNVSHWWRRMNDSLMDTYVEQLLESNLQLKEAAARMKQAWAQLGVVKGEQLPSLSLSGSATRRFQPIDTGGGFAFPIPGLSTEDRIYFTQLELGLSTSWQVDLFGKVRRQVWAAEERYRASLAETEALIHSLIAELARRRISLATLKRRLALAEETIENRRLTLETVERRYRQGSPEVSATDVYLARENLATVAADVPELNRQLKEQAYVLDVLLGLPPGTTDPFTDEIPVLPPPRRVVPGVPAHLLDRRPDLRAAEFRLIAASHQIGVAIADLYPRLTLSGNIGFQNNELEDFFDSANLTGAILGNLMVRIFEGGRLRANIDLEEARAQELAAAYANRVLNALEEVEVALSNGRYLQQRIDKLASSVKNIREAETGIWNKYRLGVTTLLNVLEIQRRHYAAEQAYLLAAQAAWNNRIALYLALGGDWLPDPPIIHPVPPPTERGAE